MSAIILEMLFSHPDEKNKSAKEIMIFGEGMKNRRKQDLAMNYYQSNTKYKDYSFEFLNSIEVKQMINTELVELSIEWPGLAERVWDQISNRPRGNGCMFRFASPDTEKIDYTDDQLQELHEYLRYEIDGEPDTHIDESYLFIGSLWDDNSRVRIGSPVIIEAPSIQSASSVSEIFFRRNTHQTTLTDWCAPIYEAKHFT